MRDESVKMAKAKEDTRTARVRRAGLTPRECEVLNLVARGLTGVETARALRMGEGITRQVVMNRNLEGAAW